MEYKIDSLEQYLTLWTNVHISKEGDGWNHFLPYYSENIYFRDSIQEIHGIDNFTKMVKRLSKRSQDLEVKVHSSLMEENIIFVEWEMIMSYKKTPKTSIYGLSRITLKDGKIEEQRDYYDLWGDIFNNIKFIKKGYRRFIRRLFG